MIIGVKCENGQMQHLFANNQAFICFLFIDLSEAEIKQKLANGTVEKRAKPSSSRVKSDVWDKFRILFDLSTKKLISNYVICIRCDSLLNYNSASCTTTSMIRHSRNCDKIPKITAYLDRDNVKKINFKDVDVQAVREAAVKFIAKDLRPFNAIEGEGSYSF